MALRKPNSLRNPSKGLSVRDWPEAEQPHQRLFTCGPDGLSDAELLAIVLRVGVKGMSVMDLSRFLLKKFQGFRGLFKASVQELESVAGLGPAKVAALKALSALTVRYLAEEMQPRALHWTLSRRAAPSLQPLPRSGSRSFHRGLSRHTAPRLDRAGNV